MNGTVSVCMMLPVLDTLRPNPDSGIWVGLGVGEKPIRRLLQDSTFNVHDRKDSDDIFFFLFGLTLPGSA